MKKVVLWVWIVVFVAASYLCSAVRWTYREMVTDYEPFINAVTFAQVISFLSVSIVGFGLLGVFMAVIR